MKKIILFTAVALSVVAIVASAYLNSDGYKIAQLEKEYQSVLTANLLIESLQKIEKIHDIDSENINIATFVDAIFQSEKIKTNKPQNIKQLIELYHLTNFKSKTQIQKNLSLVSNGQLDSNLSNFYLYSLSTKELNADYLLDEQYQIWLKTIAETFEVKNIDVQQALALMFEQLDDYDSAFQAALEFEAQAEDRELARILGLSYLHMTQDVSNAYKHLNNYVPSRMADYEQISAQYDAVIQDIWDEFGRKFEFGLLSNAFYTQYDQAEDEAKSVLYNEQYFKVRDKDLKFITISKKYDDVYFLMSVILDYGQSTLLYAMTIEKTQQSKKLLEKAEDIYLSISNDASDREDYQLFLGQVKFWLGKKEEGEKLFDQYLEQNERSAQSLSNIAEKYREIGDRKKAKQLYEEAYANTTDENEKFYIAESLYLFETTIEGQQKWMNLSDLSLTRNLAEKKSLDGTIFENEGDKVLAKKSYLEAIELYKELESTSTVLNNTSVLYSKLYYLTLDIKYLNLESESITQATNLSPTNSILLSNASTTNETYANLILQSDHFDFDVMDSYPRFNYYSYLYANADEKKQFAKKMQENKNVNNLMRFNRTLLTLKPNDKDSYYTLLSYYHIYNDMAGIKLVGKHAKNQNFELESLESSDRFDDEEFKQNFQDAKQYLSEIKQNANKQGTLQYAMISELKWKTADVIRANTMDFKRAENILTQYQEINNKTPSSKANSEYEYAIYAFLNKYLKEQSEAYTIFEKKFNKFPDYNIILIASILDEGIKQLIKESKFTQYLSIEFTDQEKLYPGNASIVEYHFYRILGDNRDSLDYEYSSEIWKAYGYLSTYKEIKKSDLFFAESVGKTGVEMKQELLNLGFSI
ncbi:MAG: hypothetical protein HRU38_10035 [Saccharospirillaceae bacterium]|nr:tetratricopeptide repeat protein [Pseudomonadales bacterium]NRB78991.1 hypothetical protein [Saccharospirillaceae bacterium]